MRSPCLKHALQLAAAGDGPVAQIVAASQEVGVIVPTFLKTNLEEAGYEVSYRVGPGEHAEEGDAPVGAWVLITCEGKKGPEVVARAFSDSKGDALLQAVYAWLKEEAQAPGEGLLQV